MKHCILNTLGKDIAPRARSILGKVGTVIDIDASQEAIGKHAKDVTIIFLTLNPVIDAVLIESLPKLQCIAAAVTGLDHIDLQAAKNRGVEVISLKGDTEFLQSITGTAELAFGLLIALYRNIPSAHQSVLQDTWDRYPFQGHSLSEKTLGIVGLGRLGKLMARYGQAFGMRVLATDPAGSDVPAVTFVPLATLLQESDAVSLHVPLTNETQGMVGSKELQLMKTSAVLINTSRGGVVDESALLQALKKGKLAGYGADVLADETEFPKKLRDHPLIEYAKTHDNIIFTPHIGGMTVESRAATDVRIAEKVHAYFATAL